MCPQVSFSSREAILNQVDAQAKTEGRSRSEMLSVLVERGLQHHLTAEEVEASAKELIEKRLNEWLGQEVKKGGEKR